MQTKRFRGFTLIELLVVIAIIGILSAVVLASLNTARSKGSDAAVQSDLSTVRVQAELYYSNTNNTYGSTFALATCPTSGTTMFYADTVIRNAIAGASGATGGGVVQCASNGQAYVVQAPLTGTGNFWCVDSTGAAKKTTAVLSGGVTACP